MAEALNGKPVTIRTLDLGADKQAPWGHTRGDNPALGLRAIRLCLAEPELFHTQLRAILRASHHGRVRILIPMLASFPSCGKPCNASSKPRAARGGRPEIR